MLKLARPVGGSEVGQQLVTLIYFQKCNRYLTIYSFLDSQKDPSERLGHRFIGATLPNDVEEVAEVVFIGAVAKMEFCLRV